MALALVFLGMLGAALLGLAESGSSQDARTSALVFLVPAVAVCLWFLVAIARSGVIVGDDDVIVRPFAGRTRRVPRSSVVDVSVVDCGNDVIPAMAPSLGLEGETSTVDLLPLMAWTWWKPNTPSRVSRDVARLQLALDLS